jgi:hypothetical protein
MKLGRQDGNIAVIDVAIVIAVGEPRCDFSQVALSDWLTAQRTERLRPGCPAIHHDEFHVPPPNEKQKLNKQHSSIKTNRSILRRLVRMSYWFAERNTLV